MVKCNDTSGALLRQKLGGSIQRRHANVLDLDLKSRLRCGAVGQRNIVLDHKSCEMEVRIHA